jgi:hypothetical protein
MAAIIPALILRVSEMSQRITESTIYGTKEVPVEHLCLFLVCQYEMYGRWWSSALSSVSSQPGRTGTWLTIHII